VSDKVLNLPKRLTPAQVAEIWSISSRTVTRYCESGKLRAIPHGTDDDKILWRIPPDAVLEYEEKYGTNPISKEREQRYTPKRRAQ
jgi:hypothetical protein